MTSSLKPSQEDIKIPALHIPLLIILGVIFWFVAALMIRWLGPLFFVPGSFLLPLTFVSSIPIAWGFVKVGTFLAGAKGAAILPAVVVMDFTAMFLDGLALTFFPDLYGPTFAIGGAWLLWGVAWTQIFAFVLFRRPS